MKFLRTAAAALLATVALATATTAPAVAAQPTTRFPDLYNATGHSTGVTVTWHNRSVSVEGVVSDLWHEDGKETVVCVFGYLRLNAGGPAVDPGSDCRAVNGRSKKFGFTIDYPNDPQPGAINSVRVLLRTVASADHDYDPDKDQFRTRNRPSS